MSVRNGLAILTALAGLVACRDAKLEPKVRPAGVPAYAKWAGGGDGGAYVYCTVDGARDVDRCSVWNDYTGQLVGSGDYKLEKGNRAATVSELKFSGAINDRIYLEDEMVLKRQ